MGGPHDSPRTSRFDRAVIACACVCISELYTLPSRLTCEVNSPLYGPPYAIRKFLRSASSCPSDSACACSGLHRPIASSPTCAFESRTLPLYSELYLSGALLMPLFFLPLPCKC
jgi:hypothetical protein